MIDVLKSRLAIGDEILDNNLQVQVVEEIYREPITLEYVIMLEGINWPVYAKECCLIDNSVEHQKKYKE